MNAFRDKEGKLDRPYLRVCSVYKLLKQGRIGQARAIELLKARRIEGRRLVEIWLAGPFKNQKVEA